jgi:predicted nucleotidyltransferase
MTEFPPDVAALLERLTGRLAARSDVVGVYVYGSLMTGDYSPSASDIDVVVLVEREPDQAMTAELKEMHTALAGTGGPAGQLHCLYVAADAASDPERLCTYWFGDRMTQWRMKLLTQAELASVGVALHGPWPPPAIKPIPVADLQASVRAELTGYWRPLTRRFKHWLDDSSIDHALIVLPRAEALLTTGELITKGAAIGRLGDFDVPDSLAREVRGRRDGMTTGVAVGGMRRVFRALLARRIMRHGIDRLSRLDPATRSPAASGGDAGPAASGGDAGPAAPGPAASGEGAGPA